MINVFNQSLWGDEGFSAILSMHSLPDIIKIISHDTSPPLWNIFEWLVFNTLGTKEVYIRGLAFIFFLGTVFFTYKIGAYLFSRKTGILAAAATFLNPFFFTYAFEGRMYSIMTFGVAASMYFFLKRKWVPYIIFTLWAIYSHHFAFFAVITQGIWFLYELFMGDKSSAKKMFKAFIIIGLGYLPWIYPLYTQTKMVGGGFWLGTPTLKDLINLIFDYLAKGIKIPINLPFLDIKLYEFAIFLVLVALIIRNWLKNYKNTLFLLSWFLVPILLAYFISQHFSSVFFNRYLLYTIPAAMLILVSNKRGTASWIIISLAVLTFGSIDYYYFTHPAKPPFRNLAAYVLQNKKEGDFLINWYSNGTHHIWETKYYKIPAPIYVPGGANLPYFVGTALMEKDDVITTLPANANRVGVITSGSLDEVKIPQYNLIESKEFGDLKYVLFNKKK